MNSNYPVEEITIPNESMADAIEGLKLLPRGNRLPSNVQLKIYENRWRLKDSWAPKQEMLVALLEEHTGGRQGVSEGEPGYEEVFTQWGPVLAEETTIELAPIQWAELHSGRGGSPVFGEEIQILLDLGIVRPPKRKPPEEEEPTLEEGEEE